MFGLIPNNLSSYGNEAVAVPHPPLRGTFPPGEGIFANPQSFKQQFIGPLCKTDKHNSEFLQAVRLNTRPLTEYEEPQA